VSGAPTPRRRAQALAVYLAVSAVLNLIWEVIQLPLYTIWRTGTVREISFAVLHCTGGDMIIAASALTIALLIAGNRRWPSEQRGEVVAITLTIGIGLTIYLEWLNTTVRQSWAYTDLMPTLPIFGTGLAPLLQWVIVPTLALYAVHSNFRRAQSRSGWKTPLQS
jgi:hypothetical protein